MKSGRRKPVKPPRFPPPRASRQRAKPRQPADQVAQLRHERDKAIEEQKAATEILEIIANSPGQLELIFSAILDRATGICGAKFGVMMLYEGEGTFRTVALHNVPLKLFKVRQRQPVFRPPDDNPLGRVVKTKRVYHMEDIRKEAAYLAGEQNAVILADDGGARSVVNVPMLRDGALLGAIGIYKKQVQPFTAHQIELVESFAKQAVIAIENARLLSELRRRTDDLTESLEQQTATAEVLRVTSSSPGELKPVFDTILENATRICDAKFGSLQLFEGNGYRRAAAYNVPAALSRGHVQDPIQPLSASPTLGRLAKAKRVIAIEDIKAEYPDEPVARLADARTTIVVPMLKENELIGAITIFRQEVRPFSRKQIELVTNFAAQAVIAIENTRLLNELRESLDRQTATSEVLNVISNSLSDAQPVFDAIVQSGTRFFPGAAIFVAIPENGMIRAAAMAESDQAREKQWRQRFPFPLTREYLHGVAILDREMVDVPDVKNSPPALAVGAKNFLASGYRAVTIMPLMRGDAAIGALSVVRLVPGPLSDKQLSVLKNFAAQAMIAIENARLLNELRQRTDDLTESLEQQTATSEVLRVISSSPGDLDPVFRAILENATNICEARFGTLFRFEDGVLRLVSQINVPPAFSDALQREKSSPGPHNPLSRIISTGETVHIADYSKDQAYRERDARAVAGVDLGGIRTLLVVPMFKESTLIGAIGIYRQEVCPFSDKQIELVQNFSAQAVIAIENTRLLSELRQRTDDLSESLEQQTATSEVLKVISSSPGDLEPVFSAMLENATRLCEAKFGILFRCEGDQFRFETAYNTPPALTEFQRQRGLFRSSPGASLDRLLQARQVVRSADDREEAVPSPSSILGGARSHIIVPMFKDNELVGAITIYRQEVRPFTDKQIEVVTNFAAQAVIAIENARLLSELRQRTDDLTESLEQQTATSEVLKVISSSPGELEPVFQAMLENATRICDAKFGTLFRFDGEQFHRVAGTGTPAALVEFQRQRGAFRPEVSDRLNRILRTKAVDHIVDESTEPNPSPPSMYGGARSIVAVPMLKNNELVGAIIIYRTEVRPFTDKQIALVSNFAAQAVIAIENTRLLSELRQRTDDLTESLQQQTATADVLKVISRSAFDLPAVLKTLVASAAQLCDANKAQILRPTGKDDGYYSAASYGHTLEYDAHMKTLAFPPGKGSVVGRVQLARKSVQIADVLDDPEYTAFETQRLGGYRTHLGVPLLREKSLIGVLVVSRTTVRPFDHKHIELIETFADQAVIAIENVRLFDEVQARTDDLTESLQQQTATADVLKVISRSTFDLKTVLDTLLKSAAHLCDADQGTITKREGDVFYRAVAYGFPDAFLEYVKDQPVEANRKTGTGRALAEGKVVHIPDVHNDPEFDWPEAQRIGGFRTMLGVPMLREGEPVGVLTLTRADVRPFTDKQIELVATFADQAAIAIENVRLFDEIQDKSRQLAEASQHKSQFLANMSHELRTPLNAILGYTELIMDGIYGDTPDKMRATLERVQRNGKHLLGLINDVLDLSKIEAGQLALAIGDYSLRQVVHDVYGAVESLAANKRIDLKVEMPNELPQGRGDERRLTQVLLNLVGNAIKFTDKGEVVIAASASNGSFTVAVRDTGPGIAKSDQGKIFDEFQQADNSLTKAKGGTGLGLAIARRIMEMHGGRLWVESEVGSGSTFTLTLPVETEQQARQA